MSGEPKTLTPEEGTLEGLIATLGIHGYSLTFQEGRWWAVPPQDTPYEWCEGDTPGEAASKALGVRVVARDEAAELRAENERMREVLAAVDSFLSHEYHRNGHRLTDKEWAGEVLRQVEAITRRRLAGGENEK